MTEQTPSGAPARETIRVAVDIDSLVRVGTRPGLGAYIKSLWSYRNFISYDAFSRLRSSISSDRLGPVWLVLTPVLNGLTYFLIFGLLLQTSRGIENFVGYLIIGVFAFQYTSKSIMGGARSIANNRKVVEAFTFPRASLPLAAVIRESFSFAPALAAMIVLILAFPPAERITWLWLLAVPILFLQMLLNLGLGLLLARLVAGTRDVLNVLTFALRIWMYASGVFYSFDRFVSHPTALAVLEANPLHQVLTMLRQVLLYGEAPALGQWGVLGGWAVGALVVGFVVFWSAEETYSRESK